MNNEPAKKHPVDEMSGRELLDALIKRFGAQRTLELIGWCIVADLVAVVLDNPADLRHKLEELGWKKSSLFYALSDIRDFGRELSEREQSEGGAAAWPVRDHTRTLQLMGKMSRAYAR